MRGNYGDGKKNIQGNGSVLKWFVRQGEVVCLCGDGGHFLL